MTMLLLTLSAAACAVGASAALVACAVGATTSRCHSRRVDD
jgi:hypothetical protein